MPNDNCFKLEAQNRRLVFEVSSSSLKDIQMVIVTLNKPDIKLTSNILQIVSPLVRNVVNDRCCQCDTPTIILPDVDARTLELLVTLLHHGEAEITRLLPDYLLYICFSLIGSGVKLVFIGKCVFYKCFVKTDQWGSVAHNNLSQSKTNLTWHKNVWLCSHKKFVAIR